MNAEATEISKAGTAAAPQRTGAKAISTLALVVLAGLMLAIGILSLMIYGACDASGKSDATPNYYAAAFAMGFGVGILGYLLFKWSFGWSAYIPLVLLTLLLIVVSSFNLYYFNSDSEMAGRAFNAGLIGVGSGLALGFILSAIEAVPDLVRIQILGVLLSVAIVIFSIFGINTYQKCDKPASVRPDLIALGVMLGIGLLAFIGVIASFFI